MQEKNANFGGVQGPSEALALVPQGGSQESRGQALGTSGLVPAIGHSAAMSDAASTQGAAARALGWEMVALVTVTSCPGGHRSPLLGLLPLC